MQTSTAADGSARVGDKVLHILNLLPGLEAQDSLRQTYSQGLHFSTRVALSRVNEREDLLEGYKLEEVIGDDGYTADSISTVHFNFVKSVFGGLHKPNHRDRDIVGIIGLPCTESALAVADLASRPQIALLNINLASSFSMETHRRRYSFSMLGPASNLVAALVEFTKRTGWRRVQVVYEEGSLFHVQLYREFREKAINSGVALEMEVIGVSEVDGIADALSVVQSSGYRVIYLFTGDLLTMQILCLSSGKGLTFPNYQYVLAGPNTITTANSTREKTETCRSGFEGMFSINYDVQASETCPECAADENREAVSSASLLGPLIYDSVWALALALNNSIARLAEMGLALSDYRYGMPEVSTVIEEELFQLEFEGVSGNIDFKSESGFSVREIEVRQVLSGEEEGGVLFAEYFSGTFTVLPSNRSWEIIDDTFPNWTPALHTGLNVVFFVILFIHLAVLVGIHIAMIVFRHRSCVKASSYRMNQYTIVGNYFLLFGLSLHNFIHAFTDDLSHRVIGTLCHTSWPWLISIGSTLITGSLALKTWRVYRIFFHYLNPGRIISDFALSICLLALVGIDILIATVWTATDPITVRVSSETVTNRDGRVFIRQYIRCVADSLQIWLGLIMLYKIVQIASLLTLTILTRKINNKNYATLNLRIVSYTFCFTVGFGFTLFFFFFLTAWGTVIDDVLLNITLNSLVLQNILLVFLPPLFPVLKEKLKISATSPTSLNGTHAPVI